MFVCVVQTLYNRFDSSEYCLVVVVRRRSFGDLDRSDNCSPRSSSERPSRDGRDIDRCASIIV